MNKYFENIFTREPDKTENGDYYYTLDWFEKDHTDECNARFYGITVEQEIERRKAVLRRNFKFNERNMELPFTEKPHESGGQRFLHKNFEDKRITDILRNVAEKEIPFADIGSAHMGMAPYILNINPNVPCLVSRSNRYDVKDVREIVDNELKLPNLSFACFDELDMPIKDNSLELITGWLSVHSLRMTRLLGGENHLAEDLANQMKMLKELYRVLKPGGCVILIGYLGTTDFVLDKLDRYFMKHEKLYGKYTKNEIYATLLRHREEDRYKLTEERIKECGFDIEVADIHTTKEELKYMHIWFGDEYPPQPIEGLSPEEDIIDILSHDIMYVLRKHEDSTLNKFDKIQYVLDLKKKNQPVYTALLQRKLGISYHEAKELINSVED